METRAHFVLIGSFVLLGCIGGLLFALWVAKVQFDAEFTEYNVVFRETVTGLSKGAAVNFNGIQVGEVRRLRLDKNDASQVYARIRVDSDTPVRADTSARLTYTGLTGVAIIELVAGAPDAPPLQIREGEDLGIIVAVPSALQKLMADGGDILTRFNETLGRVSMLLNEENMERMSTTIAHIEGIAAQIDADKAELGSTLRSADRAFTELVQAAAEFRELTASAEVTMASAERMLSQDLQPASTDLRETLQALRSAVDRVDTLIARNAVQLDQFAQQGVPGASQTLARLQELAHSLERLASRIDDRPADYLLQRDRPKEFRAR